MTSSISLTEGTIHCSGISKNGEMLICLDNIDLGALFNFLTFFLIRKNQAKICRPAWRTAHY